MINLFLKQQNHKIIKKSNISITFSTSLKNQSEETIIMINTILNLSKEYTDIFDANCYLLFIDLKIEDLLEKLNTIIKNIKKFCNSNTELYIIGMISGDEGKEVIIDKKSEIINKLEKGNIKYIYRTINISKETEIFDVFIDIFEYCMDESDKPTNIKTVVDKPLKNIINPYDIILNFNSIKSIKEGWDIFLSEKGSKYFDIFIKCPKIGIIGNKGVGKSYILSELFGFPEINSPFYTNNQITIKLKERKNKINYILFDSNGLDNPILNKKLYNNEINNDNKNVDNKKEKGNDIGDLKNSLEESELDKKLTEKFIISFIVDYSDILIAVAGILKYSEQKMLKNIMEECLKYKKDTLFIIHNLKIFDSKKQIDDYIKNILLECGTFELEEKKELKIQESSNSDEEDENSEEKDEKPIYYISKYKSSLTVYHFIFVNDYISEDSYNDFVKEKMKLFLNIIQLTKFNLSEGFIKKAFDLLKDYSKNKEEIKIELKELEENKRKIIYKSEGDLEFSNELINLKSEIQFKYNYYISDESGKLFILIEKPGNIIDIQIMASKNDKKYIIIFKGKKCMSDEEKKHMKEMKNFGRQFGEFIMEIPIKLNEYEITNLEEPNNYDKNGIECIEFNITKISNLKLEKTN